MSIVDKLTKTYNGKKQVVESVNNKAGSTLADTCKWSELSETIDNISTGTETTDATATANDILFGKTAYVGIGKVEGTIQTYDGASDVGSSSKSVAKQLIEAQNGSAENLFYCFVGTSLEGLIQYNDTENVTNFGSIYYGCNKTTSLPLINTSKGLNFERMYQDCEIATTFPQIDTSKGTNFSYMYYACSGATTFPQIDTSKGTNFDYMYYGCKNATTFPLIDTSKGTNFSNMFEMCSVATSLPRLNTDLGTKFGSMFYQCNKVPKIDISKFTSTSTSYFVRGCRKLKALIIRSFGETYAVSSNSFEQCYFMLGQTNSTNNPNGLHDGYVYVPKNMIETLQSATNWSVLQFRALEDYTKDGTCWGEFDDEKAGI